ncbi:MAG: pilus assembly PilX N-terminal domain-containing protein [Minisyncoccia bacterium]
MAKIIEGKKGFVLAFSLLISSIVLVLALGIFNILLKQIILTSSAKDSQIAFYAADAGAECALYWDTHTSRDPSGFPNQQFPYNYTGMLGLSEDNPDSVSLGYPSTSQVDIDLRNSGLFFCGASMVGTDFEVEPTDGIDGIPGPVTFTNFTFNLTSDGKVCAKVRIAKRYNAPVVAGNPKSGFDTIIESRGYNDCNPANQKRVERAIEVKY